MTSVKVRFAATLLAVFTLISANALAGVEETTVKVTNELDVAGKVLSSDAACVDERKVVLLRKRPGKDKKYGTDTAASNGKFSFGNPGLDPGRYYVKAKPIAGNCAKGVSDTFRVSGPS
jgi:hypothetical protein